MAQRSSKKEKTRFGSSWSNTRMTIQSFQIYVISENYQDLCDCGERPKRCVGVDAHIAPLGSYEFAVDFRKISTFRRVDVGIAPYECSERFQKFRKRAEIWEALA